MANDIVLAKTGVKINNGSTVISCSPAGEYGVIDGDALNTPTIENIQSKYDERFDDPKIKPGYKTSEFWFTLVSFIFSGFYLIGIVGENQQKEELITIVSHAVESIILISGQVFIFARYLRGRTEVKKIVETEKLEELKQQSQSKSRKKKNVSKRTSTSTGRTNNATNKRVSSKSKKNSSK